MPIEIKELVIRAIVDEKKTGTPVQGAGSTSTENQDCCGDKVDMLIQMIKDKKER